MPSIKAQEQKVSERSSKKSAQRKSSFAPRRNPFLLPFTAAPVDGEVLGTGSSIRSPNSIKHFQIFPSDRWLI